MPSSLQISLLYAEESDLCLYFLLDKKDSLGCFLDSYNPKSILKNLDLMKSSDPIFWTTLITLRADITMTMSHFDKLSMRHVGYFPSSLVG